MEDTEKVSDLDLSIRCRFGFRRVSRVSRTCLIPPVATARVKSFDRIHRCSRRLVFTSFPTGNCAFVHVEITGQRFLGKTPACTNQLQPFPERANTSRREHRW